MQILLRSAEPDYTCRLQASEGMRYKGLELFNNICAKCHGLTIRGAEAGPPLMNDIYRPGHHADLALVKRGLAGCEAAPLEIQ